MTATLNPYLGFSDQAREAIQFYASVLGGEPRIMTFGDMGTEGPDATKVMHAQLETPDGFTLMASDAPADMPLSQGSQISVSLSGDDAEALRRYFTGLAEGGQITMPLEKQVWGDEFGMLVDKFGIQWMVNVGTGGGQD
ncbi:VOC family protein [Arsenicicoccus sp. oral taxon 190]|uniref:VOC family protein n=1 Tax=Arsenicicoccus sp. oral taxon 190 TaxID=1658671 RepID=UPI00067A28E1|nr:VOC family protein [Arsenicicoccus sp. oral taxon 190]AKT51015.1 3-demethylubiquinone-9 3-methyltransferase [Arsenicicoccus sp. oral taxon 190]